MKNCIFISAGDKEKFASKALEELSDRYDIVINYYGKDDEKIKMLKSQAAAFSSIKTTKFISLKQMYGEFIKDRYEWVAVFDDDAKFIAGSMDDLVVSGEKFGLDIVSGAHTGKISHPTIHSKKEGGHKVRYVNFVEMNFPVFRNKSLATYMNHYDGKLCGWGNDWWYCSVLGVEKNNNAGIVDSVVIENPEENGEMNNFMSRSLREEEWNRVKKSIGVVEWGHMTTGFA